MTTIATPNLAYLVRDKFITSEIGAYVWTLLDAKATCLITGRSGAGKTTLLNSLIELLRPNWHILTAEQFQEEFSVHHPHWTRIRIGKFEMRVGVEPKEYEITVQDVLDNTVVTQRPDCTVIGEIRMNEIENLLRAAGTGSSCISTISTSDQSGALNELRANITDQSLGPLWFAIYCGTNASGKRIVTDVIELYYSNGELAINTIFKHDGNKYRQVNIFRTTRYDEACKICGIKDPEYDFAFRKNLLTRVETTASLPVHHE